MFAFVGEDAPEVENSPGNSVPSQAVSENYQQLFLEFFNLLLRIKFYKLCVLMVTTTLVIALLEENMAPLLLNNKYYFLHQKLDYWKNYAISIE